MHKKRGGGSGGVNDRSGPEMRGYDSHAIVCSNGVQRKNGVGNTAPALMQAVVHPWQRWQREADGIDQVCKQRHQDPELASKRATNQFSTGPNHRQQGETFVGALPMGAFYGRSPGDSTENRACSAVAYDRKRAVEART